MARTESRGRLVLHPAQQRSQTHLSSPKPSMPVIQPILGDVIPSTAATTSSCFTRAPFNELNARTTKPQPGSTVPLQEDKGSSQERARPATFHGKSLPQATRPAVKSPQGHIQLPCIPSTSARKDQQFAPTEAETAQQTNGIAMLAQQFSNIHQQKQKLAQQTNGDQCISNLKISSPQQNPSRSASVLMDLAVCEVAELLVSAISSSPLWLIDAPVMDLRPMWLPSLLQLVGAPNAGSGKTAAIAYFLLRVCLFVADAISWWALFPPRWLKLVCRIGSDGFLASLEEDWLELVETYDAVSDRSLKWCRIRVVCWKAADVGFLAPSYSCAVCMDLISWKLYELFKILLADVSIDLELDDRMWMLVIRILLVTWLFKVWRLWESCQSVHSRVVS
ncbi:hypothetical protein Nepgr_033544 [Nepenthes gracilis]|uniref:Uncharacterized protein n=1 Tax=Nepenthes gracilis TaxID=150966 RepID=A0AAD3TKN2_NEPGR|nr:hypothetical protein Nepgr_033544 [Nepenthes gracilis]